MPAPISPSAFDELKNGEDLRWIVHDPWLGASLCKHSRDHGLRASVRHEGIVRERLDRTVSTSASGCPPGKPSISSISDSARRGDFGNVTRPSSMRRYMRSRSISSSGFSVMKTSTPG